jgi:hypothetical protein
MPSTTLQSAIWDGHPVQLGKAFELRKQKGERDLHAVCSLQTHRFGRGVRARSTRAVVALARLPLAR